MKKKTKQVLKKKIAPKRKPVKKVTAKKKPARAKKVTVKKATKKTTKRVVKKSAPTKKKKNSNKPIGIVTHFYNEISVAIVRFREKVPLGAVLYFRGATTDFKHPVKSMQYDHKPITIAPKGKQIGIKVPKRVRVGDRVHRG
jgi:hypothetical protein